MGLCCRDEPPPASASVYRLASSVVVWAGQVDGLVACVYRNLRRVKESDLNRALRHRSWVSLSTVFSTTFIALRVDTSRSMVYPVGMGVCYMCMCVCVCVWSPYVSFSLRYGLSGCSFAYTEA